MKITVASFKGGVGKTTAAMHIAGYLSSKGSTLLVDGDPNRSCVDWAAAGKLPFKVIDENNLLKKESFGFEHYVVDTKARPEEKDLKVLAEGCDLLIVPTTPDALSLQATLKLLKAIRGYKGVNMKLLLTIVPPPPSHDGTDAKLVLENNGMPVFKTFVRRYVAHRKAPLQGVLVSDVKDSKANDAWNDYLELGKEILP
jgi:chromosome partitioning protein